MNRRLGTIKLITAVLTLGILALTAGCSGGKKSVRNTPDYTPGTLTISGDAIDCPVRFTIDELKGLQEAVVTGCYSTVNNVGTKSFFAGRGVYLSYLLNKAGIRDSAQTIKVTGSDGYTAVFTREQLEEKRFYFPLLMEGSEEGAREIPAILAWEHREGGSDLSQARSGGLRLLLGQTGLNNVVVPAYVRDVALIEVTSSDPGQWEPVSAKPPPGEIDPGAGVVLNHPYLDLVKIYYTLDGSIPNEKSMIYNPSTTYFKPESNQAVTVNQDVTIKAVAVGFGKKKSTVTAFEYRVR